MRRATQRKTYTLCALATLWLGCSLPETTPRDGLDQEQDQGTNNANNKPTPSTNNANNTDQNNSTPTQNNANMGCESELRPTPARRLSHFEYWNTLRTLYPDLTMPEVSLPPDDRPHEFDNDGDTLSASGSLLERYLEVGKLVAERLDQQLEALAGCTPDDEQDQAQVISCGQQFVRREGARLFRRPVTDEEVEAYATFFKKEIPNATFHDRLRLTLQLLLGAPEFLYRFERATQEELAPGQYAALDPYALASRLSYFIWAAPPDEQLLAAAQDNTLLDPQTLRQHAERMLNDERAKANFTHFHEQWLDFSRVNIVTKREEDGFDEATREAIKEQGRRFVQTVLFDERGSIQDLLTSPRTFVNDDIADLYGAAPKGEGWFELQQPDRSGFLTQLTFLASHGHPDKPSPVLRGTFILDRIMCAPVGAPPPNAEAMGSVKADELSGPLTNREIYNITTTSDLGCAGCHNRINPPGFALEHYDTMGRWQDKEPSGLTIDPSGTLDDISFSDAKDLTNQLAQAEKVEACVTTKWVRYAYAGGDLERSSCMNQDLRDAMRQGDGSIRDLQLAIVTHPWFALYQAPTPAE